MRLGISSGVLKDELAACRKILQEWESEISAGVPAIDRGPNTADEFHDFMRNLTGEILYVSDKLASLATRMMPED